MNRATAFLTAILIAAVLTVTNLPAASASTSTARSLLSRVIVASESGSATYDRTQFKHWVDADGDCQHARTEVLVAESRVTPSYSSASRCAVTQGRWFSYYDGAYWTNPTDVDIDHMVALKEAWESGARSWSSTTRTRYANDLSLSASLVAVTDNVNASKSDRDPAEWMPPRTAVHCTYAIQWVQVKYRWRLTINDSERRKLAAVLSGNCGDRSVTIPSRAV